MNFVSLGVNLLKNRVFFWIFWLLLLSVAAAGCHAQLTDEPTVPYLTVAPTEPTVPTTVPPTEATTAPTEYIGLTMFTQTEPVDTVEESFMLSGSSDPAAPVYINGMAAQQAEDGSFAFTAPLEPGDNTLTVTHKEETVTYQVHRRYCVQFYTPQEGRSYGSGATIFLQIAVRQGSEVNAQLYGQHIQMRRSPNQLGNGLKENFVLYRGEYQLPKDNTQLQELGELTYTVTCDGITEVYTAGPMICDARVEVNSDDPSVTPPGYSNVGSHYIVEVVDHNAETFERRGNKDTSRPTDNYLPQGTVDYASPKRIYSADGEHVFWLLRCGVRVYDATKNTPYFTQEPVVDCYTGTLPDHNEIGISSLTTQGHHSILTLDCLWKAPFFFDFEPQEYEDEVHRKYTTVGDFAPTYVDITFCYTTQITGELQIPEDHPLFSHAEWIKNAADYTLRLYLKQPGGLYGWDAYYNENDQLCFQFLNPVTVQAADNAYGADLTGVKIMIDVGHGGEDPGASGTVRYRTYDEKNLNLEIALRLQKELESIGATVILNRVTDETTTQRERTQFLREHAPDFCIAIHHNSLSLQGANGFSSGFFSPISQRAAQLLHAATVEAKVYRRSEYYWHFYYVSRQSCCINVLTECGYMSNATDMARMVVPEVMDAKARSLCQGIVDYYLELSALYE